MSPSHIQLIPTPELALLFGYSEPSASFYDFCRRTGIAPGARAARVVRPETHSRAIGCCSGHQRGRTRGYFATEPRCTAESTPCPEVTFPRVSIVSGARSCLVCATIFNAWRGGPKFWEGTDPNPKEPEFFHAFFTVRYAREPG